MVDKRRDIFFYGLFMDESVLREKGIQPHDSRKAIVHGYQLRIGQRAMLLSQASAQTFGMVYALTESETNSLYDQPGLEMYRPETVFATFADGSASEVTTYNLEETSTQEQPNVEYAQKLRSVLERLGFPVTF